VTLAAAAAAAAAAAHRPLTLEFLEAILHAHNGESQMRVCGKELASLLAVLHADSLELSQNLVHLLC
jgi:hypothetical protein